MATQAPVEPSGIGDGTLELETNDADSSGEEYMKIGDNLYAKYKYTKAFIYYEKAATMGLAEAQYKVAVMYYEGQGTEEDMESAVYWAKASAEQGLCGSD